MADTICLVDVDTIRLVDADTISTSCADTPPTAPTTPPAGSGYTAGRDAAARHARLRTLMRDDDDLMAVM